MAPDHATIETALSPAAPTKKNLSDSFSLKQLGLACTYNPYVDGDWRPGVGADDGGMHSAAREGLVVLYV